MNEHIKRAIETVGSGASFAAAIDRSPQFISQLLKGDRSVPAELCPVIERATKGAVRCEDLRPDVEWDVLRSATTEPAGKAPELPAEPRNEHATATEPRRTECFNAPGGKRPNDAPKVAPPLRYSADQLEVVTLDPGSVEHDAAEISGAMQRQREISRVFHGTTRDKPSGGGER